ncbi:radical SAM protein [candidate division KSB1 bacterium]|nr:radical SAM protein [candidate division KSB1 bacterium]
MEYKVKEFKSILLVRKYTDTWFWDKYAVNPYQGCEHACVYCDTRSKRYYMHDDFGDTVYIKRGAAEMLDKRLTNARTLLPDIIAFGSAGDAYQPVEATEKITQAMVKVILKHRYALFMLTKSTMVLRDLELIKEIGESRWATVATTIITFDPEISRAFEPRAVSPEKRREMLVKFKEAGLQVGIMCCPLLPFLLDTEENIRDVLEKSKEAGVDFVIFGGMTVAEGQREYLFEHLEKYYPELVKDYNTVYPPGAYGPVRSYERRVNRLVLKLSQEYGVPIRMKRFIPDDYRKLNYQIAQYLADKAYLAQLEGKPFSNTQWAAVNINNLKESIKDVAERGELGGIRNVNDEIAGVVRHFLKTY